MKESLKKRNSAQRYKVILDELEKKRYVTVQDFSQTLGVSEVTIRKDLKDLEKRNMLLRSHGGASPLSSLISDRHIDEKEKIMVDEKIRIAEAATRLLNKNDRIIIASGTTLLFFARKISMTESLMVITPSVKVSLTLCYYPNVEIIQLGGDMRKSSASVIGTYTEQFLEGLMCNKLFIGVDGIGIEFGLTTSNIGEAHLNHCMLNAAKEVIVLADSSKFGKQGFGKICDIERVHHIITDKNAPQNIIQIIRDKGIEVTLV
ncbi:DeoR/GlpR family DNA-binding transcription regulator [Proteiniphilum sp. X52]|uniref:DeoR/GlpR family DNA-binding transcription regulator n=1 Tax=Proteiniphilum sp. X52 TaxID=2382159 RepID=UPI000F0A0A6F|nr:DeoR/GlpR family DNA-binding transcription regulator [Proteiniphilum sp. X52]RNC66142.1 DeoR/GlpR transcriptional regulator [Proteiniphilum sp. X52]